MLQAIRSKAGSLIVKILFLVLILSFGIWGIGDIFRGSGGDTTVATVGDRTIRADDLQNALRQELERLRSVLGTALDFEQARQLGIVDLTLDRLVGTHVLDEEIERLRLAIDDAVVREAIRTNPAFSGATGEFDPTLFSRVLAANRYSEPQYVALLRQDIARSHVLDAVRSGAAAPGVLVDTLYKARGERRVADLVLLPIVGGEVGEPSEAELAEFHTANPGLFTLPERRDLTVLLLRPDDVADEIAVGDERLRQEYQARSDEFQVRERREIEQILLADREKAEAAYAEIAGGADFATVAKNAAGADPETLKLGWVRRDEMPPNVAEVAFTLQPGEVGKPVQTPFGWHIIRVTGSEPGGTKPFEEVRAQLETEIKREQAADRLFTLANQVDDALAGGASVDEVAQRFGLKPIVLSGVAPDGTTPAGERIAPPAAAAEVLRAGFETRESQVSPLGESRDGAFYLVRVDKVTPTRVQPLAEVKDKALELWRAERQRVAAEERAKAMAEKVNAGTALAEVAGAEQLPLTTTEPVTRTGAGGRTPLPPPLLTALFQAKPGQAVIAPGGNGFYVAQLKQVLPADPAANAGEVQQLTKQVDDAVAGDLAAAYDRALRQRIPIDIKREAIDRFF